MGWRIAESLKKLREQINAEWPNRDKSSDGGIGDAAHASRSSDHNPWVKDSKGQGVVTAIDIDEDLAGDIHSIQFLVDAIIASRDPRVKYIIYEGKMCSSYPAGGVAAWKWRRYSGKNPHKQHAHISVNPSPYHYDSRAEWAISAPMLAAIQEEYADKSVRVPSEPKAELILEIPAAASPESAHTPGVVEGTSGRVAEASITEKVESMMAPYLEKFDKANAVVTGVTTRADSAKSIWATVGGTIYQIVLAVIAFFAAIPREIWLTVAILSGILIAGYLARQVILGFVREKKS